MLELLVGIPLTIAAWKRGWKGWALLPLALVLPVSFFAGYIIGAFAEPGSTLEDFEGMAMMAGVAIDLIALAALLVMIAVPRKPKSDSDLGTGAGISVGTALPRFCPECGKQQHSNARFCRDCGEPLGIPHYASGSLERPGMEAGL